MMKSLTILVGRKISKMFTCGRKCEIGYIFGVLEHADYKF